MVEVDSKSVDLKIRLKFFVFDVFDRLVILAFLDKEKPRQLLFPHCAPGRSKMTIALQTFQTFVEHDWVILLVSKVTEYCSCSLPLRFLAQSSVACFMAGLVVMAMFIRIVMWPKREPEIVMHGQPIELVEDRGIASLLQIGVATTSLRNANMQCYHLTDCFAVGLIRHGAYGIRRLAPCAECNAKLEKRYQELKKSGELV